MWLSWSNFKISKVKDNEKDNNRNLSWQHHVANIFNSKDNLRVGDESKSWFNTDLPEGVVLAELVSLERVAIKLAIVINEDELGRKCNQLECKCSTQPVMSH